MPRPPRHPPDVQAEAAVDVEAKVDFADVKSPSAVKAKVDGDVHVKPEVLGDYARPYASN